MLVTAHALFSKNNKVGSRFIANTTAHLAPLESKVSHTALLINGRWVHESTGKTGVQVLSYDKWASQHTEVARISLADGEYQKIANIYRNIRGRKYDYLGVAYLGLWVGLSFLGAKIPKRNKWECPKKYFCCEALGALTGEKYSMLAPIQILKRLRSKYG